MRVGFGVDVHAFDETPPVVLGGVVVDESRGVAATSDGDVAVHALIDALLGAAALGDLGAFFPSSDPRWKGASSFALLEEALSALSDAGFRPVQVDVTVVAQSVRVSPHRETIRERLAEALGIGVDVVSVKATTTDHLGMLGRDEGIAAMAVVTIDG